MSASTTGLVSCVELWFEQFRKSWTTPNACQVPPQAGFPVVRTGSEVLNHPERMSASTTGLVSCVEQWFEQFRKSWTTPNACQVPPQAGFPVVRTGSEIWTTPNSWEIILWSMFPLELRGSTRFGRVEPPRTHVKLHWRHGFMCWNTVRTGSEELNHPELMSSSTAGLVSCVELWFEQVRKS